MTGRSTTFDANSKRLPDDSETETLVTRQIVTPGWSHRRELLAVVVLIGAASLFLWWRLLPLPHQDLNFYTEPAYFLANFGKLIGPGSQYTDLTYQKGEYFYPPGYFLILAAWIKLFGLSTDSLLGYTHAVHLAFLVGLWALLRFRYSCSKLISGLILLAVFPAFNHGRPDLTACLLSVCSWLALPDDDNAGRLILSGCFAGATALVSPGYGVGIFSTLILIILLGARFSVGTRLRLVAVWLISVAVAFGSGLAIVLSTQHSWVLAFVQFTTNAAIRSAEVNAMPNLLNIYTIIFSLIPFVFVAFLPACAVALYMRRGPQSALRTVSMAFLGATTVWFILNKSELLLIHHFLFPSKNVFMGVFYSWRKIPLWMRVAPLLLLTVISFYYYKVDFLYLATPLRQAEQAYAATVVPIGEVAVDSLYFPRFYRPWHTLNYETIGQTYWSKYMAAIPTRFRTEMLSGLESAPMKPSMILISALTIQRYGQPHFNHLRCMPSGEVSPPLRTFGHTWNLPDEPYALFVCTSNGLPR
jgi:hypothetical protein